jgi:hypothetical protein
MKATFLKNDVAYRNLTYEIKYIFKGSGRGLIEALFWNLPGRPEENNENLSQDSLSSGRD